MNVTKAKTKPQPPIRTKVHLKRAKKLNVKTIMLPKARENAKGGASLLHQSDSESKTSEIQI